MGLKHLHDLWIISNQGQDILHLQKKEQISQPKLTRNFFSGIHQFMQEMGGGQFYHLKISGKDYMGININFGHRKKENPFYLIGKFENARHKRCLNFLKRIRTHILSNKFSDTDDETFSLNLRNIILERNLF